MQPGGLDQIALQGVESRQGVEHSDRGLRVDQPEELSQAEPGKGPDAHRRVRIQAKKFVSTQGKGIRPDAASGEERAARLEGTDVCPKEGCGCCHVRRGERQVAQPAQSEPHQRRVASQPRRAGLLVQSARSAGAAGRMKIGDAGQSLDSPPQLLCFGCRRGGVPQVRWRLDQTLREPELPAWSGLFGDPPQIRPAEKVARAVTAQADDHV